MKEKTPLDIAYSKLKGIIAEEEKNISVSSFDEKNVFLHHEDGSYFIFEGAFLREYSVDFSKNGVEPCSIKFTVVYSIDIEPQIFFTADILFKKEYESNSVFSVTRKRYKPIKINNKAHSYLKKKKRELTMNDFDGNGAIISLPHAFIRLSSAFSEEDEKMRYVFSEHQDYYAFKK